MNIISSILELPKQCKQAWEEASQIKLPTDWKVNNVLVCGMGGSALGAHILQANGFLNVPFLILNNYHLPLWVNKNTLVVLASYSGGTEEVLSCAKEAKAKGCKITGITTGGKLGDWLKENNYPAYIFEPKYNSTKQPRMGVGYNLLGLAGLLSSLSLVNYKADIIECAIADLETDLESTRSEAERFAPSLKGKLPVIFAAEYLVGNAHVFANQLNESAKSMSCWFAIPEANHHLLEGLKHPELPVVGVFLGSYYPERIVKRFELTREILEKNGWGVLWYKPSQEEQFYQCLQTLLFTSLTTAYLAETYGEDLLTVPNVDYFKEKLS